MKLNCLKNFTKITLISLTTILSIKLMKNKYQSFTTNLIIQKIKKQFKYQNIYGIWIYYSKMKHQYIGGINIKENNKIKKLNFVTNFKGSNIKINP